MYRVIYKCRLCGNYFKDSKIIDDSELLKIMQSMMSIDSNNLLNYLIELHNCNNGDIGVADFYGFRKEQ